MIAATFPMRMLSELYYYLGMRIIRNRQRRQVIVVQDAYIDKIAAKFSLTTQPTVGAPLGKTMAAQMRAALDDYSATNKLKTEYQTLVGSAV